MNQTPANGFRTFLILLVTQGLSVFGSMLTYFAVNVWLTQTLYPGLDQREELALALTGLSLAFMLPQLVLGPVAGALADRWDRRKMMLSADLGLAAVTFVMLGQMAMGSLSMPVLLLLEVLSAVFATFHQSAFETSHAMLVPQDQFARANGMMQTLFSLARVFGPTTAAMLFAVPALLPAGLPAGLKDGAVLAIGLDAVSFLLSAFVLCFLQIPSPKREAGGQQQGSLAADVREGVRFLLERRPLLWLLTLFVVANMGMPLVALFPPLLLKFN
ncbi:MAG TPA: MFS transporter, partial [Symbiobacteriaceae bacterium]|nr:MFS transporter [Symbiobacteriaceae bacterium]